MSSSMFFSRPVQLAGIACLVLCVIGCSPSSDESVERRQTPAVELATAEPGDATSPAESDGSITPENILANERYWPNITALTEQWTPPDSDEPLKRGWRGALIRVDDRGRARIAFGRHGNHDVPIAFTDLISRANQIESGALHKVAANFVAHFGTQFVHPSAEELLPFPTAELAKASSFLCVFTDPRDRGFEGLARQLVALARMRPELQMLLFPLSMQRDELPVVKQKLRAASWLVPFAYPEAAEVHARALLGRVPTSPFALVVSPEGRIIYQSALDDPRAIDSIRAAATGAQTGPPSDSPNPASQGG